MTERKKKREFTQQLVIVYVLAVAFLVAAVAFVISREVDRTLIAQSNEEIAAITKLLIKRAPVPLLTQSPELSGDLINLALGIGNIVHVALYLATDELVAAGGEQSDWRPSNVTKNAVSTTHETDRNRHIVAPVWIIKNSTTALHSHELSAAEDMEYLGYVHLVVDKKPFSIVERRVLTFTIISVTILGLVMLAIVSVMTRRIAQQVQERTNTLATAKHVAERAREELSEDLGGSRQHIRGIYERLEKERKSLSREIHDELSSRLVLARLSAVRVSELARADYSPERDAEIEKQAVGVVEMLNNVYALARDILNRIRPDIIDAMGVVGAIEDMVASWNRANVPCICELSISGDYQDIPDEITMCVYRIVQESLTNITKYAHAKHVQINVDIKSHYRSGGHILHLQIADDGVGFDSHHERGGIGLRGMRERAYAVNGQISISSAPNQGTEIDVTIPVPPPRVEP